MTLSAPSEKQGPAILNNAAQEARQSPLPQSREIGDVTPGTGATRSTITSREAPTTKSWAHFVAGGFVLSLLVFASIRALL